MLIELLLISPLLQATEPLQATDPAPPPPEEPAVAADALADAFDALEAEFDAVLAAWKEAYAEADRDGKKMMRKDRPAARFLPRFEDAWRAGEGRAGLWIIDHARDAGFKSLAGKTRKRELFDGLLRNHAEAPWAGRIAIALYDERKLLGDDGVDTAFQGLLDANAHAPVRAQAMLSWSHALRRSRDDARKARGGALMERLTTEFEDDVLIEILTGPDFREHFLREGAIAPDFTTESVDGETIRLSDFRGRVVLIDFWGFW